uniref:Reverse transcriptase zinc-binding domain-containing protein n=1 Tax=Aegilops tauschii subsp. strangulata TaxID=200361 RepID=A0A453CXF0_AEGTS
MDVQLSDHEDTIHWKLVANGTFSVESMYLDLIDSGPLSRSLHIWKIKVPLRIKIFMWFVRKGVILTKDNLLKRSLIGNSRCCFCDHNETIKHLFLECPLAKLLWRSIHIVFNVHPLMSINTLFET